MRTTVRLDESLLARAKDEASRRGTTLTALIEQGLRWVVGQDARTAERSWVELPVSSVAGGTYPGVNLNDYSSLLDLMEGRG